MDLSINSSHQASSSPVDAVSSDHLSTIRCALKPLHFVMFRKEQYDHLQFNLDVWINDPLEKSPQWAKETVGRCILRCFYHQFNSLSLHGFLLRSLPPGLTELDLKCLYLSDNSLNHSITEHLFLGMDKIEILDMSNNSLSHLYNVDLSPLCNLRTLNLSFNSFTSFSSFPNMSIFPHLNTLIVTNNSLSSIEDLNLSGCVNLRKLSFDYNHISDVSSLDLSDCIKLLELSFIYNQIRLFNPILPSPPPLAFQIYLDHNLLSPREVADINATQNSSNYEGPMYFLSITPEVHSDVSLAEIPEIISHWTPEPISSPWVDISQLPPTHPDTSLYKNLALFLNRLFNETSKSLDGNYPDEVITHHVRLFIHAVEALYPSVSLLRDCSLIAEECVSTCTDRLRIGLIQISLRARKDLAEKKGDISIVSECESGLSCISAVSSFIRGLNELKIVFDNQLQKFVGVHHLLFPNAVSEHSSQKSLNSLSLDDRLVAITTLPDASIHFKIFTVGDESEDILCLLNQLKTYGIANIDDFHIRFGICVTLKDPLLQKAAIDYIFKSSS